MTPVSIFQVLQELRECAIADRLEGGEKVVRQEQGRIKALWSL